MAGAYYKCPGKACRYAAGSSSGVSCDYYSQTGKTKQEQLTPEEWAAMCAGGPCRFYDPVPGAETPPPTEKRLIRRHNRHRWTEEDTRTAMQLYDAGMADGEIGKAVGVSASVVLKWRQKNGLPSKLGRGRREL